MSRAGRGDYMRCTAHAAKGGTACSNTRTPSYGKIETAVLAGVRANMLHPTAVREAVKAFNKAMAEDRASSGSGRAKLETELREVSGRAEHLLAEVERGMPWDLVKERHAALSTRKADLVRRLDETTGEVVAFPPDGARLYRDALERLGEQLSGPSEARDAVRRLLEDVRFVPLAKRGAFELEVTADMAPVLMRAGEAGSRFIRSHKLPVTFRLVA